MDMWDVLTAVGIVALDRTLCNKSDKYKSATEAPVRVVSDGIGKAMDSLSSRKERLGVISAGKAYVKSLTGDDKNLVEDDLKCLKDEYGKSMANEYHHSLGQALSRISQRDYPTVGQLAFDIFVQDQAAQAAEKGEKLMDKLKSRAGNMSETAKEAVSSVGGTVDSLRQKASDAIAPKEADQQPI